MSGKSITIQRDNLQGSECIFSLTKSPICGQIYSYLVCEISFHRLESTSWYSARVAVRITSRVTRSNLDQRLTEVGKFSAAGGGLNSVIVVLRKAICPCNSVGKDGNLQLKYALKSDSKSESTKKSLSKPTDTTVNTLG